MKSRKLDVDGAREIAGLRDLPRSGLVERWVELHGSVPPKTLTKDLLIRGIAYELQVRQFGSLNPTEKKMLAGLAEARTGPVPGTLKPGMHLYRCWQGVTHEVLVIEGGFNWRGTRYASLSEVARTITGTRWSGPRFFGVKA